MKTLDELIKAFEWCNDDNRDECDGCPYETGRETDCHERNLDALTYLKAYKDDRNDLSALRAFWAEQQGNPPLTWDELNDMMGEPVWVEHTLFKGWRLVGWKVTDRMINLVGPYSENLPLFSDDCGKNWQAYRKERK